ncbi:hypothetical protein [Pedobacter sp.]
MNKNAVKILTAVLILGVLGYFFYEKSKDKDSVVSSAVSTGEKAGDATSSGINLSDYDKIPREELYADNDLAKKTLDELKQRYKADFEQLVKEMKGTGAKLVFCWITTEPTIPMQRIGKEFISNLCKENGVDFIDFVPLIANKKAEEITFMPVDGHFNENGARILTNEMAKYVKKYDNVKTTATYTERPKVFGDQDPNQNTITDGGKNLPYKLVTNSQGLRMDYDLTFPKTKQRILYIGDSALFFPFLDNSKTGSGQLQAMFPNKEVINAAKIGYSVDDYLSLWNDKLKYTEPDVIFLQSSGDDIADLYFTHRIKYSRKADEIKPTETELSLYKTLK